MSRKLQSQAGSDVQYISSTLWFKCYTKTVHLLIQVKATAGRLQCWWPAVITCGSIICSSSFTIEHQRENTTTAASPSMTNTHTHTHMRTSIKLISELRTGLISETNTLLCTNVDFHVSLIHLLCYSPWHFTPVIMIPEGRENDIKVTNIMFPSVYQAGEIMDTNVQLPL